jgi:hypothetical protein
MAQDVKEVPFHDAVRISELFLLLQDLKECRRAAELWIELFGKDEKLSSDDIVIANSVIRDVIVQLVSCFDTQYAHNLKKNEVFKQPLEIEYFNHLVEIRTTYAAHRFGPLRQCSIGVVVEGGKCKDIAYSGKAFAGLEPDSAPGLVILINNAGAFAQQKFDEARQVLLAKMAALTPEQVAALKPAKADHDVDVKKLRVGRDEFLRKSLGLPKDRTPRRASQD